MSGALSVCSSVCSTKFFCWLVCYSHTFSSAFLVHQLLQSLMILIFNPSKFNISFKYQTFPHTMISSFHSLSHKSQNSNKDTLKKYDNTATFPNKFWCWSANKDFTSVWILFLFHHGFKSKRIRAGSVSLTFTRYYSDSLWSAHSHRDGTISA